jgi:alpha-pyrone synthase
MATPQAFLNAIGCAVPNHDIHEAFVGWAAEQIDDERERRLFRRMAERSGIEHRWSVLPRTAAGGSPVHAGGLYAERRPSTSERMHLYGDLAPQLALEAISDLAGQQPLDGVTHLVVASCTGFVAPGVDQIIAASLGLTAVERTLIGFMGCYAAVAALRTARHIVRSEPSARVLVVTVELSTLHLQFDRDVERLLMMLQFGDGAAAALVSGDACGFLLDRPFSQNLDNSADLIRWAIGDAGFLMHLSGEVPGRIQAALEDEHVRDRLFPESELAEIDTWAVHAGGRSVLDAVARGLGLPDTALAPSRNVLSRFGNMSSSTLMFVLAGMLGDDAARRGVAIAFGPGLATEGFHFRRAS